MGTRFLEADVWVATMGTRLHANTKEATGLQRALAILSVPCKGAVGVGSDFFAVDIRGVGKTSCRVTPKPVEACWNGRPTDPLQKQNNETTHAFSSDNHEISTTVLARTFLRERTAELTD